MISDSQPTMAAKQFERFNRLSKSDRLRVTLQMCAEMRRFALDGIRHRKPGLNEAEVKSELVRMLYGSAQPQ